MYIDSYTHRQRLTTTRGWFKNWYREEHTAASYSDVISQLGMMGKRGRRVLGERMDTRGERENSEENLMLVNNCMNIHIKEIVHLQASLSQLISQSCREQTGQRDESEWRMWQRWGDVSHFTHSLALSLWLQCHSRWISFDSVGCRWTELATRPLWWLLHSGNSIFFYSMKKKRKRLNYQCCF